MFDTKNVFGSRFYDLIRSHRKKHIKYFWQGKRDYREFKKLVMVNTRKSKYEERECLVFRNKRNKIKNISRIYKLKFNRY